MRSGCACALCQPLPLPEGGREPLILRADGSRFSPELAPRRAQQQLTGADAVAAMRGALNYIVGRRPAAGAVSFMTVSSAESSETCRSLLFPATLVPRARTSPGQHARRTSRLAAAGLRRRRRRRLSQHPAPAVATPFRRSRPPSRCCRKRGHSLGLRPRRAPSPPRRRLRISSRHPRLSMRRSRGLSRSRSAAHLSGRCWRANASVPRCWRRRIATACYERVARSRCTSVKGGGGAAAAAAADAARNLSLITA